MVDLIVSIALKILFVLLLFGDIDKNKEACVKKYNPSGKPTLSKASEQDCTTMALGSAIPISSLADISSLLKIKLGSSPAPAYSQARIKLHLDQNLLWTL